MNNILKDKGQFTLNDYFQHKLAEQNKKLYNLSNINNTEESDKKYNERIYNLSLYTLGKNFTKVSLDVLNELVTFFYNIINGNEKFNFNSFIIIFVKDDRLIYSGILFVLLSLFVYFMDISY